MKVKLLTLLTVLFMLAGCAREAPVGISVNAKSAIIVEARDGKVLYEKNADKRFPPASTSKVMSAIVAIENASLRKKIIPTQNAVKAEPTVAGLKTGVKYGMKDLLAAILVKSANDAAVAIAEGVAGSEERFAKLMNAKAKKIGMSNTYFANASGLPTGRKDSQYTTARDLAKMMRYAKRYRIIPELLSQKEVYIYGNDRKRIYLRTHNGSLFLKGGASWGKTGYTKEARRTFVGMDPSMRPRIVFSLLKSTDLWNDIAILKNGGLEIYERKHKTFFSELVRWIKKQRQIGKGQVAVQLSP